jgi:hypothetical protein
MGMEKAFEGGARKPSIIGLAESSRPSGHQVKGAPWPGLQRGAESWAAWPKALAID